MERDTCCEEVECGETFGKNNLRFFTFCHVAAVTGRAHDPVGEGGDEGYDDELRESCDQSQKLPSSKSCETDS